MNVNLATAKEALDKIIRKGRVHFYKPIQIAEILYYSRQKLVQIDIENLETYRTASRRWRDEVSIRLVGSRSTSSARYQDDVFNENAIPPYVLTILDNENQERQGIVENYIYHKLNERLQDITDSYNYINQSSTANFSLQTFLDHFEYKPGLKRSVDKAYEIVVYALFSTLVDELKATVSLTLDNPDPEILADFAIFAEYVLGVTPTQTTIWRPAQIYRGGVANAADRGLDMWTNFGPTVQVKHLRLDAELADEIATETVTNDVIIVCKTAEAKLIQSLLNQIGKSIKGVITQDDLLEWYQLSLRKYKNRLGNKILTHLHHEFLREFPALGEMLSFLAERNYKLSDLKGDWKIQNNDDE